MKFPVKRLVAALLALVMCVSLCACGKKDEGSVSAGNNESVDPGFVYAAEFKKVDKSAYGIKDGVYPTYINDNGFYCAVSEVVGDNTPEGVTPEWEDQYNVYETRIYNVDFDGNLKRLENYKPYEQKAVNDGEELRDKRINAYVQLMCSDGADGFIVCENCSTSWSAAPEDITQNDPEYWDYYRYDECYVLRHLASDGKELSSKVIFTNSSETYGNYMYAQGICTDKDGNIYFSLENDNCYIQTYDKDLNEINTVTLDTWVSSLMPLPDGTVAYSYWGEDCMFLQSITDVSGNYGKKYKLTENAWEAAVGAGGDYDLYYSSGVSFYGYDIETEKEERLFSWISCDVDNTNISRCFVNKDGETITLTNTYDDDGKAETEIIKVKRVPADSVPRKETLTLAVSYLDWNLRPYIIEFNRNNPVARIDVKEYNNVEQLQTEIMAGNYPDLIDSNCISLTRLAAKDLLVDLYPYLDADPELSRDDIFPNILEALEVNGKLCSTATTFSIQTVVGSSSVVGDTPGWTYEDLYNALALMPDGCTIFDNYLNRESIMRYCMYLEMDRLVDWTTGECKFDSPEFKAILEFVARFRESFDWETDEYIDSYEAIMQGRQMLLNAYIYSFEDVMQYPALFGGSLTFIGWPTYEGIGSTMNLSTSYAMFNTCKNKEAAWEFLRYLFTEKYQNACYDMPTNINAFETKLKAAMNPTYMKDANGKFLLDDEGERIEEPKYTMGYGSTEISIYSLSEEMADTVREVVRSCTRIANYDQVLFDTIWNESQPFFLGQKSVDEVARLIQNRVNIYVNEQR